MSAAELTALVEKLSPENMEAVEQFITFLIYQQNQPQKAESKKEAAYHKLVGAVGKVSIDSDAIENLRSESMI